MAISKNTPIDFAKIALEMRAIVARWYNAEVEIVDPNTRDLNDEWDPVTNTYAASTDVTVWSGSARVQPIRSTSTPDIQIAQGAVRAIRVQIPMNGTESDAGFIQKGMRVRITNGGENPQLEELEFVVRSSVNSSYGWNQTIECDVDLKSVANG